MSSTPSLLHQFFTQDLTLERWASLAGEIEALAKGRKEVRREWTFNRFNLAIDLQQGIATLVDDLNIDPDRKVTMELEAFLRSLLGNRLDADAGSLATAFPFTMASLRSRPTVPENPPFGLADILYGSVRELADRPVANGSLALAVMIALACMGFGIFCMTSSVVPIYTFDLGYYRRSTINVGLSFIGFGAVVAWRIIKVLRRNHTLTKSGR